MSISVRNPVVPLASVFAWAVLSAAPALGQNVEGMFVTVPNPITSEAVRGIEAQVNRRIDPDNPRRVNTVVFDFNHDGKPASTANFGACLDLQSLIEKLHRAGITTVAFVHANTTGHTVLPVLTCRELVMSKSAALGQVNAEGVDALDKRKEGFYLDAPPQDRRAKLPAVIRKMFDGSVKLRHAKSRPPSSDSVYFNANEPAEVAKVLGDVNKMPPVEGTQDNQSALYPASTARAVGLCKQTAENRREVADIYGIASTVDDPLGDLVANVYRWTLKSDIDGGTRDSLARVIRDVRNKDGNVLILVINVGGHDLVVARQVADDLRLLQTEEPKVKVVGFISDRAPAAGTVVALGCNEIVMYRGKPDANGEVKEAEIGDFSHYVNPKNTKPGDLETNRMSIRDLANSQGYDPLLIDGMFLKEIEIVRANKRTTANRKVLLTREQMDRENEEEKVAGAREMREPDLWNVDKVIKPGGKDGQLLKLNATLAAELRVARMIVEEPDVKAVTAAYGWSDAKDPDPGWLDKFAEFLRMPVVTVLIVVIGFTGLILELKVPGLTVPGIIAALSFILVFWAHSKFSGQTFALALLLFLMGLVLVGIEIFVLPGFGACGIFGILCMLAGLGLVTVDKVPQTGGEWGVLGLRVSRYLFAMMGALGLAFLIARYLPRLPGANRLVLNAPPELTSAESLPGGVEAAELLGAIGTTNTPLRPAGVVKFGEKFVDVVSDGGFVPAGTRVQVIQVEGTRIVVKEV